MVDYLNSDGEGKLSSGSLIRSIMFKARFIHQVTYIHKISPIRAPVCQLAAQRLCKLLEDPTKWDEAQEALRSPPLAAADFKGAFRMYSDADPEQHLMFDLYRIQAQEALKVIVYILPVSRTPLPALNELGIHARGWAAHVAATFHSSQRIPESG